MKNIHHSTVDEKISWYARVWRQADKEALADKSSVEKQRAEYRARRQLREAVDDAMRRAGRTGSVVEGTGPALALANAAPAGI